MKEFIKKILKEEEDEFEWAQDIQMSADALWDNIEPGVVYLQIGFDPNIKQIVLPQLLFADNKIINDRIIFEVDSLELSELFKTGGGDYYVNRYMAERIFDADEFWEPYDYSVDRREWYDTCWRPILFSENKDTYQNIVKYIKKNYVVPENYNPKQLDIFGNLPEKKEMYFVTDLMTGGKERVLDTEYFNWLVQNPEKLGKLIELDLGDLFDEIRWAYSSAWNTAARDEVYKSAMGAVNDLLGEGTWVGSKLQFDVTDLFWEITESYFSECWSNCKRYNSRSSEEELIDNCPECGNVTYKYSYFLNFLTNWLDERDELLNPRFSDYPDDNEVIELFKEELWNRL